jgi:hypothetical protein
MLNPELFECVVRHCDYKTVAALRQTSKGARYLIDGMRGLPFNRDSLEHQFKELMEWREWFTCLLNRKREVDGAWPGWLPVYSIGCESETGTILADLAAAHSLGSLPKIGFSFLFTPKYGERQIGFAEIPEIVYLEIDRISAAARFPPDLRSLHILEGVVDRRRDLPPTITEYEHPCEGAAHSVPDLPFLRKLILNGSLAGIGDPRFLGLTELELGGPWDGLPRLSALHNLNTLTIAHLRAVHDLHLLRDLNNLRTVNIKTLFYCTNNERISFSQLRFPEALEELDISFFN